MSATSVLPAPDAARAANPANCRERRFDGVLWVEQARNATQSYVPHSPATSTSSRQ